MSILDHAPDFRPEDAAEIASALYGLRASASPLPSERDQNFLLRTEAGERFVLKVANASEERSMLEAQNQAMGHLAGRLGLCQRVLPTCGGDEIGAWSTTASAEHFVRLVTYLPGVPLGAVRRHSEALLVDIGAKTGALSAALQDFDHPALHREFHWDLACAAATVSKYITLIEDPDLRALVGHLADGLERQTAPLLSGLRKGIIHNDANDYNLLVGGGEDIYTKNQQVIGLIDFGDMLYSYIAGDLAVACAYAMLGKTDPLAAAARIVKGYNDVFPLEAVEISALFSLICMRLCLSVCLAAHQQARQPENTYLSISQESIRKTLPQLAEIHPRLAEAVFRGACGLAPCPTASEVVAWLASHQGDYAPPLEVDLQTARVAVLDLSVASPLIEGDPGENQAPHLTERIQAAVTEAGAAIGVGRYDEARYFYISPRFATGARPTDEYRSVHLGLDLFAPQGAPVYAPLAGSVYAFHDNHAAQDYGPVIVLEHAGDDHPTFYTLYGHLSRDSLKGLKAGKRIAKGGRLGKLGSTAENGGWTPHLHLQVICDPLDLDTDFPGVARPDQREVWLSLCPNPNLLLGIPENAFPERQPGLERTLETRRERLGRNLRLSYRMPLKIVRGWKQHLFDDEGRTYLDAYNNVAHVGHCHPRVAAAARRQIGILNTNTRYLHDSILRYAGELAATLPEPLRVCYFVNSGSEANELALRLARACTGQRDLVVLEAAYHGVTTSLIDISPYKHNGPGGTGPPDWVHAAPIPDDYRGAYKRADPQAGPKFAAHLGEIIARLTADGRGLSGFIAESLPSVGGQVIPPPGYLAEAYRHVRTAGGVCIADEVQTGLGRVGSHFWGFEMQDVVPDIVVLGKPLGNGHPLGAVVTTPAIAQAFDNGMEFFSTFGGNPVSCEVGLEVLHVVKEEGLQEHARIVGESLLAGLRPLAERFPIVGDVRGAGLFVGVELVRDRETLEPATEEAGFVADRMREHGILLGTDGPFHNVIKIRPPMPFSLDDSDDLVHVLTEVLEQDFGKC